MRWSDPALLVALLSLVVSVLSVWWSVVTFYRGGSYLRVHAFLYGEVLLLWVFNAGRTQDTVERVVLGGLRSGEGGYELTPALGLPHTLTPGQSMRRELDVRDVPVEHLKWARGGWSSVWLLLGSMQQRRAELLPQQSARPPQVGWRLAPRAASRSRWIAVVVAVAVILGVDSTLRQWSVGVIAVVVVTRAVNAQISPGSFARLRWERWTSAAALPTLLVSIRFSQARIDPNVVYLPAELYMTVVLAIAIPGGLPLLRQRARDVSASATNLIQRLRRR